MLPSCLWAGCCQAFALQGGVCIWGSDLPWTRGFWGASPHCTHECGGRKGGLPVPSSKRCTGSAGRTEQGNAIPSLVTLPIAKSQGGPGRMNSQISSKGEKRLTVCGSTSDLLVLTSLTREADDLFPPPYPQTDTQLVFCGSGVRVGCEWCTCSGVKNFTCPWFCSVDVKSCCGWTVQHLLFCAVHAVYQISCTIAWIKCQVSCWISERWRNILWGYGGKTVLIGAGLWEQTSPWICCRHTQYWIIRIILQYWITKTCVFSARVFGCMFKNVAAAGLKNFTQLFWVCLCYWFFKKLVKVFSCMGLMLPGLCLSSCNRGVQDDEADFIVFLLVVYNREMSL